MYACEVGLLRLCRIGLYFEEIIQCTSPEDKISHTQSEPPIVRSCQDKWEDVFIHVCNLYVNVFADPIKLLSKKNRH